MTRFFPAITVPGPARITRRSCEAAASLGVLIDPPADASVRVDPRLVNELLRSPRASVTLLAGPSGSGKSVLLRAIDNALRERGHRVIHPSRIRPARKPLVDLFPGSVDDALRALARAGLAEAGVVLRTPDELSVGQRARLDIALAMSRATPGATLLLDEFGASLDSPTAHTLSATLQRFVCEHPELRAFVATTRDDLEAPLAPDTVVQLDLFAGATIRSCSQHPRPSPNSPHPLPSPNSRHPLPSPTGEGRVRAPSSLPRLSSSPVPRVDRAAATRAPHLLIHPAPLTRALPLLALHHYRPTRPARLARTLIATEAATGETVGALVIAMPTLNARWRDLAWPGRFSAGSPRARAERINRDVRTIARVVVDPRYRAVGVATELVRAYLEDPLTPLTEAVSAMGRATGCFARAGMRAIPLAPPERHARLLDALDRCTVEPWRLATPDLALRRAVDAAGRDFVEREARRWANASRATRRLAAAPLEALFREACRAVAADHTAFVT